MDAREIRVRHMDLLDDLMDDTFNHGRLLKHKLRKIALANQQTFAKAHQFTAGKPWRTVEVFGMRKRHKYLFDSVNSILSTVRYPVCKNNAQIV